MHNADKSRTGWPRRGMGNDPPIRYRLLPVDQYSNIGMDTYDAGVQYHKANTANAFV